MGMLLSLGIAFSVTPWLARLWMKPAVGRSHAGGSKFAASLERLFERVFTPLLDDRRGRRNRGLLGAGVALLIVMSLALPALGAVILKMLPFDNKSEFQVVVDMPAGTPLEQTAGVLHELGAFLVRQPEVSHYQAYAGTASPINFNGLMRQYYLRSGGEVGDLQVTLRDKAHRSEKSHAIVKRLRPGLQAIGRRLAPTSSWSSTPGPPVLSPLVARSTGRTPGPAAMARAVRRAGGTPGVVDDDSSIAAAPRKLLLIDRRKAALLGVRRRPSWHPCAPASREDAAYLHDEQIPPPALLQLPAERHGELDALLQLHVRGGLGSCADPRAGHRHRHRARAAVYHKDLLPVNFVIGDVAGRVDSPLYSMFAARGHRLVKTQVAAHRLNTSSRRATTATTPSNGTANGRSPTKPSATWALPMPSG
jgi:multidrug efflux pump subunit AcrB